MSTSNAAKRNQTPDGPEGHASAGTGSALSSTELKAQVAERLAAHRTRRGDAAIPAAKSAVPPQKPRSRIAAAVAQRYAESPSYRTVLAAEAERAIRQAQAAAQIANLNAQAIVAAHQQLLQDLGEFEFAPKTEYGIGPAIADGQTAVFEYPLEEESKPWSETAPAAATASSELTVHLYEEVRTNPLASRLPAETAARTQLPVADDDAEARALDEEIAFRHDPVFEEPAGPAMALPANLIEFPRQLVASRKARPRHAEGPLRDEPIEVPGAGQLRIFEVESAETDAAPAVVVEAEPEWASIHLDALDRSAIEPLPFPEGGIEIHPGLSLPRPNPAPLGRRFTAAAADGSLVLSAFLIGSGAFAYMTGQPLDSLIVTDAAAMVAAGVFAVLWLLYQMLFFSFGTTTPGMRFARIALCTFSDENPSRADIRWRVLAMLASIGPLGLGILWAAIDRDGLTWHDRISRIYQRSY